MADLNHHTFGGRLRPPRTEQSFQDGPVRLPNERLAFVYQRLSTYEQVKKSIWSLELQNRLVDKAKEDGYPDELIYVERRDLGLSGTLGREDRPGLAHFIQLVEAHQVESAYVVEIGRLYRDTTLISAFQLGELLKEHGVVVVTPWMRPLDLRNDYDMEIYRMEAQRAARELRMMKGRLIAARDAKAEQGLYSGEALPPGIVVDPRERVGGEPNPTFGQFIVYEPHAEVVRLILDRILAGWPRRKVARWCWDQGIVFPFYPPEFDTGVNRKSFSKSKRTVSGWIVTVDRVQSIAMNPAYVGWRIWKGQLVSQDAYPPIVEESKFWAIQERLSDAYRACPKKGNDPLPLAGLLHYRRDEAVYGMTYSYQGKDDGLYTEQIDNAIGQRRTCFAAHILDGPVSEAVLSQIALPDLAEQVLTRLTDEYEQARELAASYRREMRRLEKEIETIEENFDREVLSKETLARLEERIQERRARIRELADLESRPVGRLVGQPVPGRADIKLVQDFLGNLKEMWDGQSNRLKNDLLRLLLAQVVIWNDDEDREIIHARLVWRVGLVQEILIHRPYASYVFQTRRPWTEAEVAILREHFAATPKPELMDMLPGRVWEGIRTKARLLGLSRPAFRLLAKPRAPCFTADEDALVRKFYAGEIGPVEVLATGRTMDAIRRRGARLRLKRQQRAVWEWVDKGVMPEEKGSPDKSPPGCHSPSGLLLPAR